MRLIALAVPRVATIRKPRSCSCAAMPTTAGLVGVGHGQEHRAGARQLRAGRGLGLRERGREVGRDAHHLAGGAHLRAEQRVGAGEAVERQHGLLDRDVAPYGSSGRPMRRELLAEHHPAGELGQRQAGGLGHERDRPRRARVGLDHVQVLAVDAVLDVDQADHAEREREVLAWPVRISSSISVPSECGGSTQARVARVDAGLLDVLHDAADPDVLAVADRVDVDLDRVLEEAVEEDLALRPGALEVVGEHVRVVDELHRAAAEHVARADEQREADVRARRRAPPPGVLASAYGGALSSSRSSSAPKRPRSSARSIASGWVPSSVTPAASSPAASRSGVWPPKETITPSGCSISTIASTSSSVSGSKYRRSRRVVVGGDGLRVAVDHHRVAAGLAHGHRGVHAAVVELDALADPVRAGAEDHHARLLAAADLGRAGVLLPGGVVVRRLGLELGRAGVDGAVGADALERRRRAGAARAGTRGRCRCGRGSPRRRRRAAAARAATS